MPLGRLSGGGMLPWFPSPDGQAGAVGGSQAASQVMHKSYKEHCNKAAETKHLWKLECGL